MTIMGASLPAELPRCARGVAALCLLLLTEAGCAPGPRPASRAGSGAAVPQAPPGPAVLPGNVVAVAVSGDGRVAAMGGHGAIVLEMPSLRPLRSFPDARVADHALALSRDGAVLAAPDARGKLVLWDVSTGRIVERLRPRTPLHSLAFSPTGKDLALGGAELAIDLYDLDRERWQWRKRAPAHGDVRTLSFSADGRWLLSGARISMTAGPDAEQWEESPRLWHVPDGAQLRSFDFAQPLSALSADGQRAAGAADIVVRIWETRSGREIATLQHYPAGTHDRWVMGVGLSPDGARAYSLGDDATLVAWDVAAEREIGRVIAHSPPTEALAVSPDGRHALVGARDGTVRLWELPELTELAASGKAPTFR